MRTQTISSTGLFFRLLRGCVMAAFFSAGHSEPAFAQTASEQSYQRARQILEAGLKALGGMEAIAGVKSFTIVERTNGHDDLQNPTPGPPYDESVETIERFSVDFPGQRLIHEIDLRRPHFAWRPLTILSGGKGYRIDQLSRTATAADTLSLNDFQRQIQKLPQFYLLDILNERAATLRYLGESDVEGRKQQVITFIDRNNRLMTLYFDVDAGLLTKTEYLYTDPAAGDTTAELIYAGYRSVGALRVPTGAVNRMGPYSRHRSLYEIQINPKFDDALFSPPADLKLLPPLPSRPAYEMRRIGEGIFLLEKVGGAYNVLVVAFDDFLFVAEAPEERPYAGLSEMAIAKIKATIPGKSIRYLTFSHHHLDHGAGVRGYIAEGATIVTTKSNQSLIESIAAAKFERKPDAFARSPRPLKMEFIEDGKRVIQGSWQGSERQVEIHNIGPYWHVADELLLYLPKEKLLFEGDLFTSGDRDEPGVAQDHQALLAEKIRSLGLDVDQIAGVHGRLRPIADLQKMIRAPNEIHRD
jgi:glyoxylase-like metal-dependent hydrolase (beta-lactamase superfamily II)